jgi:hypothetical protein
MKAELKAQLQSNLHSDLRLNISLKHILATELTPWALEVKEYNDWMWAEDAHTQKLINTSATAYATCCGEKKDLLSHLADLPAKGNTSPSSTNKGKHAKTKCLPALMLEEQALLDKHAGCT